MREVLHTVTDTLTDTVHWCHDYPAEIGRKIEGCIGVYGFTAAAR